MVVFKKGLSFGFLAFIFLSFLEVVKANESDMDWTLILKHPTSQFLKNVTNAEDYLRERRTFVESLILNKTDEIKKDHLNQNINKRELNSLVHQRELVEGIEKNPKILKELQDLGLDTGAHYRACFDSDMGKLLIYRELFTIPSEKSDFLFKFLQGKVALKSWEVIKKAFQINKMKMGTFLNSDFSPSKLRSLFHTHPILISYLHEFPGMIDAVIAFELNKLTENEFKTQILVNLGHAGPSEGYWKYLESVLLPKSFENDPELLKKLFTDTIYMPENESVLHHPHYPAPALFDSYIAIFFDRMSQATRSGFIKIDQEVNGDPLHAVNELLLKTNNLNTTKQIEHLKRSAMKNKIMNKEQREYVISLCNSGIKYLKNFKLFLQKQILFQENSKEVTITINSKDKHYQFFRKKGQEKLYFLNEKEMPYSKEGLRKELYKALMPILISAEEQLGDPFKNNLWR